MIYCTKCTKQKSALRIENMIMMNLKSYKFFKTNKSAKTLLNIYFEIHETELNLMEFKLI